MSQELPPLNALRAFEAAARLQSVSLAAEQLHVTHGAVSRQIRALEEHLGVPLFVKEGRGLKLTDAGLRLQLSASEGELDPRRAEVDATLWFAEPPWPADMQVFELAVERIGPVLSPRYGRFAELHAAPAAALLGEPLLHTSSRPQAWPSWAARNGLDTSALRLGQGFEHLYYLLEAAAAGLGVAIAPQQLVADDLAGGRLVAPWGFVATPARLALWVPARRLDKRAQCLADWLRGELNG